MITTSIKSGERQVLKSPKAQLFRSSEGQNCTSAISPGAQKIGGQLLVSASLVAEFYKDPNHPLAPSQSV